jgi:hypothetical protein
VDNRPDKRGENEMEKKDMIKLLEETRATLLKRRQENCYDAVNIDSVTEIQYFKIFNFAETYLLELLIERLEKMDVK